MDQPYRGNPAVVNETWPCGRGAVMKKGGWNLQPPFLSQGLEPRNDQTAVNYFFRPKLPNRFLNLAT
jgi:hypothetical protein